MATIEWFGHSCFLLEANGLRILIDPFQRKGVRYPEIDTFADLVLITHNHSDHNNFGVAKGNPTVIRQAGHWETPVLVDGIEAFHDSSGGLERGTTMIYSLVIEGMRITHLGDIGEIPNTKTIEALNGTNILLIPVGGVYTIDHKGASKVLELIRPNIAIPMHYKNEMVDWPLNGVEKFLIGKSRTRILVENWVECTQEELPQPTEVWVPSPPGM